MQPVIEQEMDQGSTDLAGLGRDEFAAEVARIGAKPFRAKQLWRWVYGHGVTDFAAMTNIAKPFRGELSLSHTIGRPRIAEEQKSSDGTRKWLVRLADGHEVETVFIPESDRGTLCISSQVGCTLTCRFCHTGTQRLVRNLTAAEIVGQLMLARDALDDWPSTKEDRAVTNIVMMGMGEPLYNFDAVKAALQIFLDPEGIAISRRRITLSTAGVVPLMRRCGEEIGVNLAVSLHAVSDALRDEIVPLNRKYPIADLLEVCRGYPGTHNARRITFEYVMLKDVNDSAEEARQLARLLGDIPAKINLIPFNPWPGAPYECSEAETIGRFADILSAAGLTATVRQPRGRDILAACGQLKSASERPTASARRKEARSEARP